MAKGYDEPHRCPRRIGKHVQAALSALDRIGAIDVKVFQAKHVRIDFEYRGARMEIQTCCTPRLVDIEARRVRKRVEELVQAERKRGAA